MGSCPLHCFMFLSQKITNKIILAHNGLMFFLQSLPTHHANMNTIHWSDISVTCTNNLSLFNELIVGVSSPHISVSRLTGSAGIGFHSPNKSADCCLQRNNDHTMELSSLLIYTTCKIITRFKAGRES